MFFILLIQLIKFVSTVDYDDNGYLVYCPCMGKLSLVESNGPVVQVLNKVDQDAGNGIAFNKFL